MIDTVFGISIGVNLYLFYLIKRNIEFDKKNINKIQDYDDQWILISKKSNNIVSQMIVY